MKFFITKHCKERYTERINNGLNKNDNLILSILKDVSSGKDITDKVYNDIPRYILFLYEKYGTAGQRIIKNGNSVFITKKREGTNDLYDVFTCYTENSNHLEQYKNTALSRQQIFEKIALIKKKIK